MSGMLTLGSLVDPIDKGWHIVTNHLSQWAQAFDSRVGPLEVAGLIVVTVASLVWAFANFGGGSERELSAALRPYRVRPRLLALTSEDGAEVVPLLKRVSGLLATFAERRGFRDTLAARLQRAGLPIEVGEFLGMCLAGLIVLLVIFWFVAGPVGVIFALVFSFLVPLGVLQTLMDRRKRQFASQIPDVLKLLAASLRAGFSLLQGLDAILYQVKDPMASELRRAFAATRLGTSIEDALDVAADRVGSRDFAWTVMAIRIQREVGGNLAEILETVAATMTERDRLRREVHTLTAEGRLSAIIVAALPFALAAMIYVVNRPYLSVLFTTFGGELAVIFGFLLELAGVYWLYRIVQIEI